MDAEMPLPPVDQVAETPEGTTVTMKVRTPGCPTVFLAIWLMGWLVGEVMAIGGLTRGGLPLGGVLFMLLWLVLWSAGGAAAALLLAFMLGGTESIIVDGATFSRRVEAFGKGRAWSWPIAEVNGLHATGSFVECTVRGKRMRWGTSLSESAAARIAEQLIERYPQLR